MPAQREWSRTTAHRPTLLGLCCGSSMRGPYSNAEVVTLIRKDTGQEFSHTTIWKLRNGQAANPQMRLIEALARTFGVPAH